MITRSSSECRTCTATGPAQPGVTVRGAGRRDSAGSRQGGKKLLNLTNVAELAAAPAPCVVGGERGWEENLLLLSWASSALTLTETVHFYKSKNIFQNL